LPFGLERHSAESAPTSPSQVCKGDHTGAMSLHGPQAIDRVVVIRAQAVPLYVFIQSSGRVTSAEEVSETGNEFLTTRTHGNNQISFQSIDGHYLSAEGGDRVGTRRYCGEEQRFVVERVGTLYAFRSRSGKYLSVLEKDSRVALAAEAGESERFQLFPLMMNGLNVGRQLDMLEKKGFLQINGILDEQLVEKLQQVLAERGGTRVDGVHEIRSSRLATSSSDFAQLAVHPLVMQLVLRGLSPAARLSDMESCCTNADHVRKELEATTWHVVHPYSSVEFQGLADPKVSFTATWFLDELDESNSTWAWTSPPRHDDGPYLPKLPHLVSPEEVETTVKEATPLVAPSGSLWLFAGPMWMSNNVGAASFWRDYDAQTRYRHLSGQQDATSFRALTDAQHGAPVKERLCPTLVQATYVREYVARQQAAAALGGAPASMPDLSASQSANLTRILA